ncbi:unnamed protein product [Auanema sp. JU1783]|nr:unnamed protein product [Auanema sp. JU1783]
MCSDYHDLPGTSVGCLSEQTWYHGMTTRIHSESILKEEGEFLVRDSISQSGGYVLTVRWKGKALHFQINSTSEKGRKMYHFEEEYFATVPHLINFYTAHRRPITLTSGCLIKKPAERQTSFEDKNKELEASYMHIFRPGSLLNQPQRTLSQQAILNQASLRQTLQNNCKSSPRPFTTISEKISVPPLSASLSRRPLPVPIKSTSNGDAEDYCDIDYDAMEDILDASSSNDHKIINGNIQSWPDAQLSRQFQSCFNLRSFSPVPSYKSSSSCLTERPPLPPRPINLIEKCRSVNILDSIPKETGKKFSSDLDYDNPRAPKTNNDYDMLLHDQEKTGSSNYSDYDALASEKQYRHSRQRDSGVYTSPSPPNEITNVFSHVHCSQLRIFLLHSSPNEFAKAITHDDVKLLQSCETGEMPDINNGLRQILLPIGTNLRASLLIRSRQLQVAVLLSIITSPRSEVIKIVEQWIQTLGFLLHSEKNFFGFANVIIALEARQLKSHQWLWSSLDSATKALYDQHRHCYNSHLSQIIDNTLPVSIPFLQPILQIFSGLEGSGLDGNSFCSDLDSLWFWLDNARSWLASSHDANNLLKKQINHLKPFSATPLSVLKLDRLFLDNADIFEEDRFVSTVDYLQKMVQDVI